MTQAQAQTVASALIALGVTVQVIHTGAVYTVNSSSDTPFSAASVAAFAAAQGVTGTVTYAVYS